MMHYPDVVIEFLHLFSSNLVGMTTPSSRTFPMEAADFGGLTPFHSFPFPLLRDRNPKDWGRGKHCRIP